MIRRENSEERIFIQIWVLTENSGESGKSGNFWHHNQKLERTYFWLHVGGGEKNVIEELNKMHSNFF